jgi:hypothetical protein
LALSTKQGHAVAGFLLTRFVGEVSITSDGKHLGQAETWDLQPSLVDETGDVIVKDEYAPQERADYERAAMIVIAGPVAETILRSRNYYLVLDKNPDDQDNRACEDGSMEPYASPPPAGCS